MNQKYDFSQKNLSEMLVFCASDSLKIKRGFRSFAHLSWATWAIFSHSLICFEQSEQIAHIRSFDLRYLSKWAMTEGANSETLTISLVSARVTYSISQWWPTNKLGII